MVGYCVEGMNNVVVACFKLTKQFCLSVVFIQDGRIFGKWKFTEIATNSELAKSDFT